MDFQSFVDDIRKNEWTVHGAEVYENGRLIHRFGDNAAHRYPIDSATKTITVLPERKLMVTCLAHMEADSGLMKECMEKHLLDEKKERYDA